MRRTYSSSVLLAASSLALPLSREVRAAVSTSLASSCLSSTKCVIETLFLPTDVSAYSPPSKARLNGFGMLPMGVLNRIAAISRAAAIRAIDTRRLLLEPLILIIRTQITLV